MAEKLLIEEGDLKGLSLSLEDGKTWVIGRDLDECQLVIEDASVSRKHLLVQRTPEGIVVENLSTTNPTFLNNQEMDKLPHLLQNGDTIKMGNEVLRYFAKSSPESPDQETLKNTEKESEEVKPLSEEPSPQPSENLMPQHTIFEENDAHLEGTLAEIDFGVPETGRWLLKVVGGPNNGAEFYMSAGNIYLLGTDPESCDIIFHDTSVSRQHAKITITPEETLMIEDLKSRNGVLINGTLIENNQPLPLSTIITLGTTSFAVYDREGQMQTIISPLLPSIVKVLQKEASKTSGEASVQSISQAEPSQETFKETPLETHPKSTREFSSYIIMATVIGLFILAGIGTSTLFQSEPIVTQTQENANELIEQDLNPFPALHYTFNQTSGKLLLFGHVTTLSDKNQLLYKLQTLRFIKSIDDSGIVIDEYVWQEINSVLSKNPAWRGISIYSPKPGQFVLSGYLPTRKEAEQLSSYISLNFHYLDSLETQILVEEDILNEIHQWLQERQLSEVVPQMVNDEVTLTGAVSTEKANEINAIVEKIKNIRGIHAVYNQIKIQTTETGVINISDQYKITGTSKVGTTYTVIINGRILSVNDDLDGMTITKITPNRILLQKDETKYRIDY